MSDLTYGQWQAALKRAQAAVYAVAPTHAIVEAALGCPCPPEPPPEPFVKGEHTLVRLSETRGKVAVRAVPRYQLTPEEATAMGGALLAHAAYARKQEARQEQDEARERWKDHPPVVRPLIPAPTCGHYVGGGAFANTCQRSKGHTGLCQAFPEDA